MTGGSILSLVVSFLAFQIGLVGSQSGKMVSALSLSLQLLRFLFCTSFLLKKYNLTKLPRDHFLVALNRYERIWLVSPELVMVIAKRTTRWFQIFPRSPFSPHFLILTDPARCKQEMVARRAYANVS